MKFRFDTKIYCIDNIFCNHQGFFIKTTFKESSRSLLNVVVLFNIVIYLKLNLKLKIDLRACNLKNLEEILKSLRKFAKSILKVKVLFTD